MYRHLKHKPGTNKLLRPLIKFNGGRGAILCRKCRKIIRENLSPKEWFGAADHIFCKECAKELILKMFKTKTDEQTKS